MTWTTLKASIAQIKESNEDILVCNSGGVLSSPTEFNNTNIVDLYLTNAKDKLKLDLQEALNLDYDDTTTLDEIVLIHELRLTRALAYLQLVEFYRKYNEGEGSAGDKRMKYYLSEYNSLKSSFAQLKNNDVRKYMRVRIVK